MSDQHRVDEGSSRYSSEGVSDVQDHPEGSSQNNDSNRHQNSEEKPKEMETGKENVNSDGIGVEPLLSREYRKKLASRVIEVRRSPGQMLV